MTGGIDIGPGTFEFCALAPVPRSIESGIEDGLFWEFDSDWDAVPDLHDFVEDIGSSFDDLRPLASASEEKPAPPEHPPPPAEPAARPDAVGA